MSSSATKQCVLCGGDVTNAPRVKDSQGHYICRACHDHHALHGAGGSANAGAPSASLDAYGAVIDLAPSDAHTQGPSGESEVVPLAPQPVEARPCPSCRTVMNPGDVICLACGYDARSRLKHATTAIVEGEDPAEAPKPKRRFFEPGLCGYCGYGLEGLPSGKCPECGQLNSLSRRDEQLWQDSRQLARDAYLRPLFMFLGGFAAISAILLFRGKPMVILWELAKWACEVPVGVGVFWVCCLTFLGFDAPMRLVALRLAGIYAITDAIYLLLAFQPVWIWPVGISGLVYIYLLSEELEMERSDAAIVGVLTFFAKLMLVMVASMYLR